jgi:hypothetical protein
LKEDIRIMKKMEEENLPRDIKILVLTKTGSIEDLIGRVEELESNNRYRDYKLKKGK